MDDETKENEGGGSKPWWTELMKEATLTGLATVFMTEDSVRNYLKDKKLPKEFASLLMDGLSKKKDGFYDMVKGEFAKMLAKIDFAKEMQKFFETHDMQVQAKISFSKKDQDK